LGILGPERQELWWDLKAVHEQAAALFRRIERGSPAAGRTLLVKLYWERRHEAKSLLRAARSYDPNHPSSARIRSFLEELELKE
jgi:hypothetical protein